MSGEHAVASRPASGRRATAMIVIPVLLATLVVMTARATPASAAAYCGRRQVTVVVDFTKLHGKVKSGCDRKRPANGLVALRKAGFTYAFVPRQPGFICTIDRRPSRCNGAPTSAYWSYWHARPHGRWIYSNLGAASYHPKTSWVEGWAFGRGKPPRIPPP
jgi:hypothetical protein